MNDIAYILLAIGCLLLCVAFVNLITDVYLPKSSSLSHFPLVSILVPARNEEANINHLLNDIHSLSYPNYEVIVFDDLSTDATAAIVKQHMGKDARIRLIQGEVLPPGWLGKNYACHQLALEAQGEYLLFLDADVRVEGELIETSLRQLRNNKLGLLSVFPKQILDHVGSWLTVPLMNWILLSLLPLVLVRLSTWIAFSAANGQFMLFDRVVYKRMQPHLHCKQTKVEDIAICRYFKRNGIRVATLLGNNSIRCKMYNSIEEGVNGFAKNVFAFFGGSIAATLLFAIVTTLAPFFLLYTLGIKAFLFYLLIVVLKKIIISKASCQNVVLNLLYMPAQQLLFLFIITTAIQKKQSRRLSWKGRSIA